MTTSSRTPLWRRTASWMGLAGCLMALSGCFPLAMPVVMGGAFAGGMVATDRRTAGTVVEDNSIQLKAGGRIDENLGDRVHVNVTSYNRRVLLTGEVPNEQDRKLVEQVVRNVENVEGITNELAVMGASTLGQRSSDALVSTRIKARLIDAHDLVANAFKYTTERGAVYIMGRVTEREAKRATEIIRTTEGVQKLVILWDIISEDELARMLPATQGNAPAGQAASPR